jgi:hypothetical protein
MLVGFQESALRAYTKDGETALLIANEAKDPTARFQLTIKYKGVAIWDDEEGVWRVVVDLEWPNRKSLLSPTATKKVRF